MSFRKRLGYQFLAWLCFATALAFAAPTPVPPPAISLGGTKDDVLKTYGPPQSRGQAGNREIFVYKEGTVTLEEGVITEVRFLKGEPKRLPTPSPTPTATPPPNAPNAGNAHPGSASSPADSATPPNALVSRLKTLGLFGPAGVLALVAVLFFIFRAIFKKIPQGSPAPALTSTTATPAPVAGSPAPAAPSASPTAQGAPPQAKPASPSLPPEPAPQKPKARLQFGLKGAKKSDGRPAITQLDRTTLDRLEWRRFEELCEAYFTKTGGRVERKAAGTAGVDLLLYQDSTTKPVAGAQVKHRASDDIGASALREFHGLLLVDDIAEGFFVTNLGFTQDAQRFAEGKPLHLISGDTLLAKFAELNAEAQKEIIAHVFRDDFETPTCPACDVKMVLREAERPFWACPNSPRCNQVFHAKTA